MKDFERLGLQSRCAVRAVYGNDFVAGDFEPCKAHGASVRQIALAWLLQRSPVMLPIPGTANIAHLEENVGAAKVKLTPDERKAIDAVAGKIEPSER